MINQSGSHVNKDVHYKDKYDLNAEFFCKDFQTLYDTILALVTKHVLLLFMPCCGILDRIDYICYGKYTRKLVIDARLTGYQNGIPQFERVEIREFKVQRIKHKKCGHTHGALFELFIPFQKYTIRFVLIHLKRYYSMHTSIESYCLDNDIPIKVFREWIQWMKRNMSFLTEIGAVKEYQENKKNISEWLLTIMEDIPFWITKSLTLLNLSLFQRHSMPANYTNRSPERLLEYKDQHAMHLSGAPT